MYKRTVAFFTLFLVVAGFVTLQQAQAQTQDSDPTIGYVNPQAILNKMPEMKAVQQRLNNFRERKLEELQSKQEEFQQQVTAYEQKSAVISEEAKQKEEKRLGQLQSELQQYQTQLQQELQQKQQELVGPLLEQINQAINTVAEEQDLTYVFNTSTSDGTAIILYASSEMQQNNDITDSVMQQLGI